MVLDAESLKTLESLPGKRGTLLLRRNRGDIGGGMFVRDEGGLAAVGDRWKRNPRVGPPAPRIRVGQQYRQSGSKGPRIGLELRLASPGGASPVNPVSDPHHGRWRAQIMGTSNSTKKRPDLAGPVGETRRSWWVGC